MLKRAWHRMRTDQSHLLRSPVHVKIRSPTPDSPDRVRGFAPHLTANRSNIFQYMRLAAKQIPNGRVNLLAYQPVGTAHPILHNDGHSL